MGFIKRNSNKVTGVILSLTLLGSISFGTIQLFSDCKAISCFQSNSVKVCKIDDNHAKLHCDSVKISNSDFLFNKSQTRESYQYDLTDLSGEQKYYAFNSPVNISFSDGLSNNPQLSAAIWGIAAGGGGAAILGAASTIGGAALAAAPVAGAIAGAGGVAAANGLGFMAGAALATSVAVAAAPVAVVGGALVGAAGIGWIKRY